MVVFVNERDIEALGLHEGAMIEFAADAGDAIPLLRAPFRDMNANDRRVMRGGGAQ
jgi:hypothetical protein